MIIYKIYDTLNDKAYIGQTSRNLEERWREHCKPSLKTRSYLSNAIQKYGKNVFTIEIIATASTQIELDKLECEFIRKNNSMFPNGYNLKMGGSGGKHSDVVKNNLRQKNLGKKLSDDTKQKISNSNKNRRNNARKPILGINIETGHKILLQSSEEGSKYGFDSRCIWKCAKGLRNTHKKYKWNFA